MKDILRNDLLESYLLFVRSIHTLLQQHISNTDLEQCNYDLHKFVGECQINYGEEEITFNLHSLLHLPISVQQSGPLWSTSTFPYESGIFKIKQQVRGPNCIDQQVATKYVELNAFKNKFYNLTDNEECRLFISNLYSYKNLSAKSARKTRNHITLIGKEEIIENTSNYCKNLNITNYKPIIENRNVGYAYNRCIFNTNVYHSTKYTRACKTDDTVIHLYEVNQFVVICNFLLLDDICYTIVRELVVENVIHGRTIVKHMHRLVGSKKERFFIRLDKVKHNKTIMINNTETYDIVCIMPNNLEIQ